MHVHDVLFSSTFCASNSMRSCLKSSSELNIGGEMGHYILNFKYYDSTKPFRLKKKISGKIPLLKRNTRISNLPSKRPLSAELSELFSIVIVIIPSPIQFLFHPYFHIGNCAAVSKECIRVRFTLCSLFSGVFETMRVWLRGVC